jgi:hypothetical protein
VSVVIGLRATFWVLTIGIRLLAHPVGRRLLAAMALISLCAGLVILVFTYPEPVEPDPVTRPAVTRGRDPMPRSTSGTSRPGSSPEQTAAAWYAGRKRLPRSRVRVLQRDEVNPKLVRVLVLADAGGGRLDTAVVEVRRLGSAWRVDP